MVAPACPQVNDGLDGGKVGSAGLAAGSVVDAADEKEKVKASGNQGNSCHVSLLLVVFMLGCRVHP